MATFLPLVASPTFTSFGGIAHCVPESNSVDSISLPSGSLSPTLIVMGTPHVLKGEGGNNTQTSLSDGGTHEADQAVSHSGARCCAGRRGAARLVRIRLSNGVVGIPPRLRDAGLGHVHWSCRSGAGGRCTGGSPGPRSRGRKPGDRARGRCGDRVCALALGGARTVASAHPRHHPRYAEPAAVRRRAAAA